MLPFFMFVLKTTRTEWELSFPAFILRLTAQITISCFDTCTVRSLLFIIQLTKANFTINTIYKLLFSYMFRHQICHPQGARSVSL